MKEVLVVDFNLKTTVHDAEDFPKLKEMFSAYNVEESTDTLFKAHLGADYCRARIIPITRLNTGKIMTKVARKDFKPLAKIVGHPDIDIPNRDNEYVYLVGRPGVIPTVTTAGATAWCEEVSNVEFIERMKEGRISV